MYVHTALGGQWIILLAFLILFPAGMRCYLLGGFSSAQIKYSAGRLDYFSFNLNEFVNARDFSAIVKALTSGKGQYEGFAYLGAGIILLLIVTVCSMISKATWDRIREYIREKKLFYAG